MFFIERSFFRLTANTWPMDFSVICIPFVCLGQEDDGEVKKDEFSETYERLAKEHGDDLPDF